MERPRDLRGREVSPCDLLSAALLTELDLSAAGRSRLVAGHVPSCAWEGEQVRRRVSVAVWVDRDYLVDVYRSPVLPIVRRGVIAGLPAVERQQEPNGSYCNTVVGVADGQALDISVDIDDGRRDPCAEGRRVAEAIVATLPPKAG